MDDHFLIVLSWFIGAILFWVILYFVVKAAVRNGILESKAKQPSQINTNYEPDVPANLEQQKLQMKYDNGEITFEQYKNEWDRLGRN